MRLPEPDRASFVELNRTRLRLWSWGDERDPPVLLLHGAFDHGRMFDGIAPQLAGLGHHVVAPDLRGHGDSGPLFSGNVWFAMNLDIAMLARHVGAPVGIVAHSFGGGQALVVAGAFPELVRWIVSIDGLGPPADRFDEGDLAEAARHGVTGVERVHRRPPRVYASKQEMAERRRRTNVRMSEEWARHLVEHGSRPADGGWAWKSDPVFNAGVVGPFNRDMLLAQYRAVRCPVLVLTGSEPDTWSDLPDQELRERLAAISDARHRVVEGAGHYAHLEQPEAVVGLVEAFAGEVGR
jgi:pimeloyl-ACP methyl ester carboxylesterase